MNRQGLLRMLELYENFFPEEGPVVARIRRLVEHRQDCFLRTCRPGHITGAAWILSHDRRRVLLTHHRKLDCWLQLGGHADGDADVLGVALREAREESGLQSLCVLPRDGTLIPLDVDVHEISERRDAEGRVVEDAHQHYDIRFLLLAPPQARPVVSDESHDVRWFTAEEVVRVTQETSVLRMLHKSREWMQ